MEPIEHPPSTDRFIIDPRQYKRDWPYIGCVGTILIFGLGIGILALLHAEGHGREIAAMSALIFLPVLFFFIRAWNRVDLFQVSPDGELTLHKGRNHRHPQRVSPGATLELVLEYYQRRPRDDGESVATLNLWDISHGSRRRNIIGAFISLDAKEQVMEDLARFLTSHGFHVESRNLVAEKRK